MGKAMLSLLMDLPITSPRERELRQACRGALALGLVTIAYGLIRAPWGLKSDLELVPYMWPFLVAWVLYLILGWWLYKAHVRAWETLSAGQFQMCPLCAISLVRAPNGGTCMECEKHRGGDELRAAWIAVYRRHVRSTKPLVIRMPAELGRPAAGMSRREIGKIRTQS